MSRSNHTTYAAPLDLKAADELIKARGVQLIVDTVKKYCDDYYKPLLKGEQRDQYFFEKIRRIRIRYFEIL